MLSFGNDRFWVKTIYWILEIRPSSSSRRPKVSGRTACRISGLTLTPILAPPKASAIGARQAMFFSDFI